MGIGHIYTDLQRLAHDATIALVGTRHLGSVEASLHASAGGVAWLLPSGSCSSHAKRHLAAWASDSGERAERGLAIGRRAAWSGRSAERVLQHELVRGMRDQRDEGGVLQDGRGVPRAIGRAHLACTTHSAWRCPSAALPLPPLLTLPTSVCRTQAPGFLDAITGDAYDLPEGAPGLVAYGYLDQLAYGSFDIILSRHFGAISIYYL